MSKPRITSQSVTEVIPSDSAFSEKYLRQTIEQKNIAARRQAIQEGIIDADAGKLTCPGHRKSQMAFTVTILGQNRETLLIASTRYRIAIWSLSDSSR
jgi:hypothetical protein